MERTFKCYILEDPQAVAIKEKINKLEADLAQVGWARSGLRGKHMYYRQEVCIGRVAGTAEVELAQVGVQGGERWGVGHVHFGALKGMAGWGQPAACGAGAGKLGAFWDLVGKLGSVLQEEVCRRRNGRRGSRSWKRSWHRGGGLSPYATRPAELHLMHRCCRGSTTASALSATGPPS